MHVSLIPRRQLPFIRVVKGIVLGGFLFVSLVLFNNHAFLWPTLRDVYHPGDRPHVIRVVNPSLLVRTADPKRRWMLTGASFPFTVLAPFASQSIRVQTKIVPSPGTTLSLTAQGADHFGTLSSLVYSSFLNGLTWSRVSDGDLTVWQRPAETIPSTRSTPRYASVTDFLSSQPPVASVGGVGVDRMALSSIHDYHPATTPIVINQTFRGSHQFYVYAANESVSINFTAVALNRVKGKDSMVIRLARADHLRSDRQSWLMVKTLGDDGITSGKSTPGPGRDVSISLPNVQPGFYLVDVVTTDDMLIQRLTSLQHILAFSDHVVLADGPGLGRLTKFAPVVLQTNGPKLTVAANHSQGLQDIQINGSTHRLKQVKVDVVIDKLPSPSAINIAKDDVRVSSSGLISPFPAQLPQDAGLRTIDLSDTPNLNGLQYIVADYTLPSATEAVTVGHTFVGSDLAFSRANQYHFSLEVSGAATGVDNLRVAITRGAYPWQKLWQKVRKILP